MEMQPIYTDTYFKTTSPKNDRGLKSESRLGEHAARVGGIIVYITKNSVAEEHGSGRSRESRRGSPRRRGTGPCTHRAKTKDPPPLIMGKGGC